MDLLVEPDLHTYRQRERDWAAASRRPQPRLARGAPAAANDDATLDKNVVRRATRARSRRGARRDGGHEPAGRARRPGATC